MKKQELTQQVRELSLRFEETELIEKIDQLRKGYINISSVIKQALLDYPLEN